jgi:phospholipid transport system substrate-binding protein
MKFRTALLLLFAGFTAMAQAQTAAVAPDVLVKNVTNEVLQIIRGDKDIQAGNNEKAIALIEAKVLPHFNFTHMTQLAVGRNWKDADATQQKQLADEFHTLLVRTYAKSLTEYRNQTVDFKPAKINSGDTKVEVSTRIMGGSTPIALNYYLEQLAAGWQVYDIEVGGISLVLNYRDSFAAEVSHGGMDGLLKSLQNKNRTSGHLAKT